MLFYYREIKPFISLLIILLALLLTAFFKITLRKMSYSLYQKNKEFNQIQDKYYSHIKEYHKKIQPDRLQNLAKKHDFEKKKRGQIIQVIDGKAFIIN